MWVLLTIRVAFQSLLTSLLGSWVTLKLGLKQKEWGVLWEMYVAQCQPDGGRPRRLPPPSAWPRGSRGAW